MYQQIVDHCSKLSATQVALFGLVLAVAIEALTIWTRFGLGLQATRDTGFIGTLTFGVRVHHGYVGVLLAILGSWLFPNNIGLRNVCWMIALALILSDLMHHFLVLWPTTGSPEFDLVYPSNNDTP